MNLVPLSHLNDPPELPSFAGPKSDSDGNGSPTPLIYFGQFAADLHAGRLLPIDPNFSQLFLRAEKNLIVWYYPSSGSLHSHSPLSLSISPNPFPGLLWQITNIQLSLSQIFVKNHPELVVLLKEAEDTSLLRLLAQLLIHNYLALGTEIFLEPQGICSGDQKLNMSFDFGSLEPDSGTGIVKLQDLARQPHGVVNWKK
jgi:hypothetical protein